MLRPESNDSGNLTPEAMLGDHATNGSISQPSAKSNAPDENSSKRKALPDATESEGAAQYNVFSDKPEKMRSESTRLNSSHAT